MGPFEDTLTATLMLPTCDLILCLLFYYFYILTTELKCFVNVFNNIVMRLPWKVKDQSSLMGLNHNFHGIRLHIVHISMLYDGVMKMPVKSELQNEPHMKKV